MNLTKDVLDTIIKNGGGTFTYYRSLNEFADLGKALTKGYAVSVRGGIELSLELDADTIINKIIDFAKKDDTMFLGLWVNNGTLYIDSTMVVYNKDVALRVAKEHNQLAIYDFSTSTSLNV
jgi:hypothetical protein